MDIVLIWGKRETEYFCGRGWTGGKPAGGLICPSGNHIACLTLPAARRPCHGLRFEPTVHEFFGQAWLGLIHSQNFLLLSLFANAAAVTIRKHL